MNHRKAKKPAHQPKLRLVGKRDTEALAACFADQGQVLLPLLELVQDARASIDELMNDAARTFVEQLLVVSAQEVAGEKHPGKYRGAIRWHGSQRGRITLAERKLAVKRPPAFAPPMARPRSRPMSACARRRGSAAGGATSWSRVSRRAQVRQGAARDGPGTVGIKKSSVSTAFVKASATALKELGERRLEHLNLLALSTWMVSSSRTTTFSRPWAWTARAESTCSGWRKERARTPPWPKTCSRA
jgi:hypothetical protein